MRRNKKCMQMDENMEKNHRNSKLLMGLFVIAAGTLILLKQTGMPIPHWMISWEMMLIVLGIVLMIKHNFKKVSSYVVSLIGFIFLMKDFYPDIVETKFIWPVLIIVIGFSMIVKYAFPQKKKLILIEDNSDFKDVSSEDYITANAFFSGITKKVVSKNFKGAHISSVFGGNEINLSQADFTGEVTIDVTCVFGGVTLIIPANWKIKSDLTSVFGGIDDQRPNVSSETMDDTKTIYLKGGCVFGGIEIHSYM